MTEEKQELEQSTEASVSEEVIAPAQEAEQAPVEAATEAPTPSAEAEQPEAPKSDQGSHVDYSASFRGLSRGDLVEGVVVHIDREGVLVDVGQKSEGIIRPGELSVEHVESPEDVVSVGDTIKVMVMEPEDRNGNIILSKKRADFEKAWDRVQEAFEKGAVIMAMVTDRVKGGLQVDLGIRGFVPGSHVGSGKVMNLDRFVGQSLPLKVIEIDRERRKVVLSHRMATEEQRGKQREETMGSLAEGQVREGVVRRITDYGAFVDLGGVDGLLHISEMSWTRITHPSDMVKVGAKINVMILKLDMKSERISLGLRQILPDPWSEVEGKYRVGDIVTGHVSRLVPFGAFVQLESGIEGIIPNPELSHKRVKRPEDVVTVGETVEIKILDVRPEERRMTLSLRALQDRPEPEPVRQHESYQSASSGFSGRMTLADLVGDKLHGLSSAGQDEPAAEPVASEAQEVTAPEAEIAVPETEAVVEAPAAEEPVVEVAAAQEAEAEAPAAEETSEEKSDEQAS